MDLSLDHLRSQLGREPRKIGFFGWRDKVFAIPSSLKGATPQDEPLLDTLLRQKDIWREGRIVLGHVVVANRSLYWPGAEDMPGEVVYSLTATDEEAGEKLPLIVAELTSAKFSDQKLSDFPADQQEIVSHLRQEMEWGFGMKVPASMSHGLDCHVCTFWGHREFLPGGCVGSGFVPLLVLVKKVHDVLILPEKFWLPELLVPWNLKIGERQMRKKMSVDRIKAGEAWAESAAKSAAPVPWKEATPESIAGAWAWEMETVMHRWEDGSLGSQLVRSVWTFDLEQRCRLEIETRLLINGEMQEDAPLMDLDYEGTFELEAGRLVATLPEHEDSPLRLVVVSLGEIVNDHFAMFHRTTPPPLSARAVEVSEGGSTLYRHTPRAPGIVPPDMSESNLEAIDQHIEEHIGKIENVWHELISDLVHIDVHVVPPRPERPYYTLVTSGMSDMEMTTPEGAEEYGFGELMICLPPTWKLSQEAFEDERHYWPIRWLKSLARLPHEYSTWLARDHTIPNGNPAEPLAEGSPFCGFMLVDPMTTSVDFHELIVPPAKVIHFYAILPLTADEMDFKLKHGATALRERLARHKVTELVDPKRRSVLR